MVCYMELANISALTENFCRNRRFIDKICVIKAIKKMLTLELKKKNYFKITGNSNDILPKVKL